MVLLARILSRPWDNLRDEKAEEDLGIHRPLLRRLHRLLGLCRNDIQHRHLHHPLLRPRSSLSRLHTELLRSLILDNSVFILVVPIKALVVISELNSARTLRRCLDCLLNQDTEDDYRIWVIDGGSTDGS